MMVVQVIEQKCDIIDLSHKAEIGDTVIAYYDDRPYAFKGKMTAIRIDGDNYVEYDDGGESWAAGSWFYKFVAI